MYVANQEYDIDAYKELAAAIVKQAVIDYERALRHLKKNPLHDDAKHIKEECESFFIKDLGMYSNLDGRAIIQAIKDRVKYNDQMQA